MGRESPEAERVKAWRRRVRARWLSVTGRQQEASYWLVRSLPGFLPKDQVRLLYRTVGAEPGPGDIAEVGSFMGKSTITIARSLLDHGVGDCRVYAIDPHRGTPEDHHDLGPRGSTYPVFESNVRAARVDRLIEPLVMTDGDGAVELARRGVRLRLAFIDGPHDEDSVRRQIRDYRPLVKRRGLMAFHDCDPEGGAYPGVWTAVEGELLHGAADVVDHAGVLWVLRLRD